VAREHPEKLRELQQLFLIEAARFNVLPLDSRSGVRLNPDLAGRPRLLGGNAQMLYPTMKRLSENSVLSLKNKSFSVTAGVEVSRAGSPSGVVVAQGGAFGGWSLYLTRGRLAFYNLLGMERYTVQDSAFSGGGIQRVRLEAGLDSHDHLVDPEHLVQIAMTRQ
jgi:hypothetical protein